MLKIENVLCCNKIVATLKENVSMFDASYSLKYDICFNSNVAITFEKVVLPKDLKVLFSELIHNNFIECDDLRISFDDSLCMEMKCDVDNIAIKENEFGFDLHLKKNNQIIFSSMISDVSTVKDILSIMLSE